MSYRLRLRIGQQIRAVVITLDIWMDEGAENSMPNALVANSSKLHQKTHQLCPMPALAILFLLHRHLHSLSQCPHRVILVLGLGSKDLIKSETVDAGEESLIPEALNRRQGDIDCVPQTGQYWRPRAPRR
jgi:hypothetical protein